MLGKSKSVHGSFFAAGIRSIGVNADRLRGYTEKITVVIALFITTRTSKFPQAHY
jgi:hypothetical protein